MLLLGAGASVKSGIPLTGEIVERAAKFAFCRCTGRHPQDAAVVRSDWLSWLQGHEWYQREKSAEEHYSEVIQNLLVPRQVRKDFFLQILNPAVPASPGYHKLLDLMDWGHITTVLTTNFDRVLPDLKVHRRRPHHLELIRTPADYSTFSTAPNYPQLLYLHGSVEHYTDQNLIEEVSRLNPELVQLLSPFLRDHPLVVIGYRGAEPSIMKHLLIDQLECTKRFRQGIYWCVREPLNPATLHPLVDELAAQSNPNFQFVPISGFDEVMDAIYGHCTKHSVSKAPAEMETAIARLPHDMRPLENASLEAFDWTRIREEVVTYCQRMQIAVPENVSREWLVERLCDLDLAARSGSKVIPTVAGYLLFAAAPQTAIRGAFTRVVIDDGDSQQTESLATGNLWVQLEQLSELIEDFNQPFIVKSTRSETVYPYPKLALREALINAFVHRAYDNDSALLVEVGPGHLRITNPGGLVDEVAERAQPSLQRQIESGIRGLKGYRNPVLADLLYGSGRMEKRGSGLPDVYESVKRNGGRVVLGPDQENRNFSITIFSRPELVNEQTRTAVPATNRIPYFANLLELSQLPKFVSVAKARTDAQWDQIGRPPVFHKRDGTLYTFADLSTHVDKLGIIDLKQIATEDWVSSDLGSRDCVGLLNICLYHHFEQKCHLVVDRARKRAYFPRTSEGPRELKYQAVFRRPTRTVTKVTISASTQRVLYWVHEAFWFGIERYSNAWAIRILPGYVFTIDGKEKLLDHKRVGALATKRAARDFNLQVHNDLVFWAWVLSRGKDPFTIDTGGEPLLTQGRLANCEIELPAQADVQMAAESAAVGS